MDVFAHALRTVTFAVLSKCLESSMHKRLYICMGFETLAVLFKRLESSVDLRLVLFKRSS